MRGPTRRRSIVLAVLAIAGCQTRAPGVEPAGPEGTAGSTSSHSLGRSRAFEPAALAHDTPTLEVLTFNVNFGVGHDPINVAAVAEIDADLVLLQETTTDSEAAFREALSSTYPHMLFRDCCNAGGLGILSKQPIREEQWLEPTIGWFPAWRIVVDTPIGPVQALDVHLRPPMSDGGSWVAGFFTTRDDRRAEIAGFWPALSADLPTIIAGDFNEDERGQAIEFLRGHGLQSALAEVDAHAKTWRWPTKVGELRMMLDHVVYGRGLRLHGARVLERGTSDHFPVVVVLSAAPTNPADPTKADG